MTLIRRLPIAVVCTLAVVAPVRAQTLFSDTFSDGSTSGWTRWGDIMHDGGGVFRNSCCNADAHYAIDAGFGWTDYTYSVDHYADDDDVSGITFRIQDSNNFYLLTQGFGDNDGWNLRLSKYVGGSQSNVTPPFNNQGGAAGQVNSENTWYNIKVELSGTSIKCYVDDVLKFDITDSTYAGGSAGVWMDNQTAQCRFDNALVVAAAAPLAENYRSIGTDSGVLYNTGNASIAAGSTTMTFAGATLPSNVGVGDKITVGGTDHFIKTKDSSSQVTVCDPSAGTHSSAAYSIRRAYNTIQSWENARDGDLVGENRCEYGVCYNDGPFSTITAISGSTTDATHYMTLTVAEGQRHNGTAGTGAVIDAGGGGTDILIHVSVPYTRVEWLEMTDFVANRHILYFDLAADNSSASHLLIHDYDTGGGVLPGICTRPTVTIRDSILYNGIGTGILIDAGDGTIENCTVYNMSYAGIYLRDRAGAATATIRNTISVGSTADFDLNDTISYFGNNMYGTTAGFDPDSYQGNNQNPPGNLDDLFVSIAASENLHLETTGHNALDTGLDLSSSFTTDIDGENRTGSWDIGADEMTSTLAVNYRSIGTNGGVLHSTGNASIVSGSMSMTFAGGASLPSYVGVGDEITIGGDTYYIKTKTSSTQVTVDSASTSTHSSAAYSIQRAYNTMQSWEDARDGNLVGENRREVGVCYDDGSFTTITTINGSTTDDTHYMTLTVAEGQRHDGTGGSGVVIDGGGGFGVAVIEVKDQYTRVEWLEITDWKDNQPGVHFDDAPAADNSDGSSASHMLMHDFGLSDGSAAFVVRSDGIALRNCMIYDGDDDGIFMSDGSLTVENCTIYAVSDGIKAYSGSSLTVRNTISVGSDDDDFDLEGSVAYFDYNMYGNIEDYSPSGGNDQSPPGNLNNLFVSISSGLEDLHLESIGHNALDTGVDVAGFTTDIDGESRVSGTWDIGADEAAGLANYRSIGTASGTIYSAGSATIAVGGRTVTFAGATLPANIGQGDRLVVGGETFYIMSRDSATQVTTQDSAASGHTGSGYTISRAYNTFQSWESARDGDLVGEQRREVGVAYNDSEFTPSGDIDISGSTSDATYYMMITVAEGQRHTGIAGTGVRINGSNATDQVFTVVDNNVVIEWLEIRNFGGFQVEAFDLDGSNSLVQNLIIHDFDGADSAMYSEGGFTLRNTIIYDGSQGMYVDGVTNLTIQNLTIRDMSGSGIIADDSTVSIANSIVVGCVTDIELNSCTIDYFGYNMYSTTSGFTPASYDGNNQSPPADLDDLFYTIAPGSEDLHLEDSGHSAVGTGLDLSADFTIDIDGEARTTPWDIGADAVVAALWVSSGQDQSFTVGDSVTAISPITITDAADAPVITAADDIRVRIPAGLDMEWDYFDGFATITGTASGKVLSAVSYEDSNKTLVLDVTGDFVAGESIAVSDLSFSAFGSATSGSLELDIDDDATADAIDDKTITIDPAAAASVGGALRVLSWSEVEPSDAPAPPASPITFDGVTTDVQGTARGTATFSHTISSGSCCDDAILVVVVGSRGDHGCSGVTYNSVPMAPSVSERASTSSSNEWLQVYYMVNPPTGTNTVEASFNISETPTIVAAMSYFGVDQSSPIGAVASDSQTTSGSTVTVDIATTVANSVVVGGLGHHGGDTDPHDPSGDVTTEHYDEVSGTATGGDSSYAGGEIVTTTTGIYTFEWTNSLADDWAIVCVELKPAP